MACDMQYMKMEIITMKLAQVRMFSKDHKLCPMGSLAISQGVPIKRIKLCRRIGGIFRKVQK